ncbi:core histone H2A/H2B/H3/H4 [Teladorsagia circumcincta]|uniref:Histone H4 n=1 Tax=Teladorsagia circumcincta TaxID=45464 RepID=A0A2G9UR16_TELCI|nr:core histone H2A/H2B/H3/H4 [Teladorsagia circumcincta]
MPSRRSVATGSIPSPKSVDRKIHSSASLPSRSPATNHRPVTRRSTREQRPVLIVPPEPAQLLQRFVKNLPIPRSSIRKLAVKAGVKRLRGDVYEESLQYLESFLDDIIYDTIQYCLYAKRKTIQVEDVKNALKRRGLRVYGFDD